MSPIDYVMAGVLLVSMLIGLWRGLVAEVLALAIWVGSIWVAWMFGPQVAAMFEHSIHTPELRLVAGYAVCLVGVLVVGALVKAVFHRLVVGSGLSGPDRALGVLFGLGRGVLLVALMVFLLGLTPVTRESWWRQSMLLPHFQSVAIAIGHHLPASTARYLRPAPAPAPEPAATPAPGPIQASLPAVRQLLDRAGQGGQGAGLAGDIGSLGAALRAPVPAPTSTARTNPSPTADPAAVP